MTLWGSLLNVLCIQQRFSSSIGQNSNVSQCCVSSGFLHSAGCSQPALFSFILCICIKILATDSERILRQISASFSFCSFLCSGYCASQIPAISAFPNSDLLSFNSVRSLSPCIMVWQLSHGRSPAVILGFSCYWNPRFLLGSSCLSALAQRNAQMSLQ